MSGYCVAVCCSVLQCVAVCCSVLQCVAVCCSVLQCVASRRNDACHAYGAGVTLHTPKKCESHIYCNTQQHTATHYNTLRHTATHCNTLICIVHVWRQLQESLRKKSCHTYREVIYMCVLTSHFTCDIYLYTFHMWNVKPSPHLHYRRVREVDISNVKCSHFTCDIYFYTFHMWNVESRHIQMAHIEKSCHSHVTCDMYLYMWSQATHINGSYHTYEWVVSPISMSHVAFTNHVRYDSHI